MPLISLPLRREEPATSLMSVDDETRVIVDSTVHELVTVALEAGLDIRDLNQLLDSGLGLDDLVRAVRALLLDRAA